MAKRHIDSDLINKRWYRELKPEYKVLWIHMILMCDHAGILDVDIPMWKIRIGEEIKFTEEEILEVFGDKIYAYKKHKWWVTDYIDFQQTDGNIAKAIKDGTNNKFYKFIINRLQIEGLTKVYVSPSLRPYPSPWEGSIKDKGYKIKDKGLMIEDNTLDGNEKKPDKKEVKKLLLKRNREQFELIWSEYPNKSGKKPGGDKYKVLMPDEDLFNLIYADITERSKSYKWREEDCKYVPLMTTYLNQERWNDEMFAVDAPVQERNGGRGPYIEDEEDD